MKKVEILVLVIEHCRTCEILAREFAQTYSAALPKTSKLKLLSWSSERDFEKHGLYPRVFPTVLLKLDDAVYEGWEPCSEFESKKDLDEFILMVLTKAIALSSDNRSLVSTGSNSSDNKPAEPVQGIQQ